MKIQTSEGVIEVQVGAYVFNEASDMFRTWDQLDLDTRTRLEGAVMGIRDILKGL